MAISKNRKIKNVLITGINGSGGSYLAEFLLNNTQTNIYGTYRWHSTGNFSNLNHVKNKITLYECDLTDLSSVIRTLNETRPDAIFHMASHANVNASFLTPLSVINNNVMATANLLEGIRLSKINPLIQICSTSEVYGQVDPNNVPIKENCPLRPASPYAVSKVTQDLLADVYYKSYKLRVIRTRMFSYLNPRRTDLFATSFCMQIARIEQGKQKILKHGNLNSIRTFIDVRDAMEAYWIAITKGKIGEVYNIGGFKTMKVGEVLEILKSKAKKRIICKIDPQLLRPSDVTLQIPDVSKFKKDTGWKPKYSFKESLNFLLEYCRKSIAKEK